jgi:hypothetical protein
MFHTNKFSHSNSLSQDEAVTICDSAQDITSSKMGQRHAGQRQSNPELHERQITYPELSVDKAHQRF